MSFNVLFLVTCILVLLALILYLFFWNRRSLAIFCLCWFAFPHGIKVFQHVGRCGRVLPGICRVLDYRTSKLGSSNSPYWPEDSVQGLALSLQVNQTVRLVKDRLAGGTGFGGLQKSTNLAVHESVLMVCHSPNLSSVENISSSTYSEQDPLAIVLSHSSFRQGFEWFLYNRTAAYDHVMAQMQTGSVRPSYSDDEVQHSDGLRKGLADGKALYCRFNHVTDVS